MTTRPGVRCGHRWPEQALRCKSSLRMIWGKSDLRIRAPATHSGSRWGRTGAWGKGGGSQSLGVGHGPVSHRVVGGLVAWCRDKGHLERLGWWLVLGEKLQEQEMLAGGRWPLYRRGREWLAGEGPRGPSSGDRTSPASSRGASSEEEVVVNFGLIRGLISAHKALPELCWQKEGEYRRAGQGRAGLQERLDRWAAEAGKSRSMGDTRFIA
jgi:hypothetical protein